MILLDANLLIYAFVRGMPQHSAAKRWLDEKINGRAIVGMPWPSLLAFMRITTNPRVFERPASITDAWAQIESWLYSPVVRIPLPTERHREVLATLIADLGLHANLIPDAHIAALAIEHGLTLCSTDGDFARFPNVRWENPLTSKL